MLESAYDYENVMERVDTSEDGSLKFKHDTQLAASYDSSLTSASSCSDLASNSRSTTEEKVVSGENKRSHLSSFSS